MRVLLIHSDYLEFEAKRKALKSAEEVKDKKGRAENVLVVFMAGEKPDETEPDSVVEQLVAEIKDIYGKVKAESIVLYPYAHLSSNLSSPKIAQLMLEKTYEMLKDDYNVIKAPFGWYKSFELKCKGHPLSELSRTITPSGVESGKKLKESEALQKEEKIKSSWHIMSLDGKLHEVDKFNYKGHENLKKFALYEEAKSRTVEKSPPHVDLMRRLELVDYEPASDAGNLRYYPKGRMIKALLEQYVTQQILEYGGLEVETPIMYDFEHPTLKKYLNRFPARQYTIKSDEKSYFLRFAACFGQFLMAHDATISYRNLPLKLYEMTRYSFRREKSGELTGLRRLRAFTMPDVHALCSDEKQAMVEYKKRLELCISVIEGVGLSLDDIEPAIRVTKKFFEEHKEFIHYIVKRIGKPTLIEVWDERIFYFILKYEFNFIDALNNASCLSTDQIDVENGERYDMRFTDKDGVEKYLTILHCSPSGAIERIIYVLLEKAYMSMNSGAKPMLPMWLSPTQVRLIPVSEEFKDDVVAIAEKIKAADIRVDVDDRNESISKKIRGAEKEWVPQIIVFGENEKKSGKLSVRVRQTGKQKQSTINSIICDVKKSIDGKPFRGLPLPMLMSARPKFVG